ncbi:MAG: hypothetical protein WCQ72_01500 [Eubacteriales bacterium]
MILTPMQTTVAYRCPYCGACVTSPVGVFSLSGDMYKLKCTCGQSEMTITMSRDGKVRLDVPCIICPKPHNYVISREVFFGRELFTVMCSYSAMEIAFIGTADAVGEAFERSTKALAELIGVDEDQLSDAFGSDDGDDDDDDEDIEDVAFDSDEDADRAIADMIGRLDKINHRAADGDEDVAADTAGDGAKESAPDVFLVGVIRFLLSSLREEGGIECGCTERGEEGEYDFDMTDSGVRIFCGKCGCWEEFDLTGVTAAQDFIERTHIKLRWPEEHNEK